jgi:hypothetical protein
MRCKKDSGVFSGSVNAFHHINYLSSTSSMAGYKVLNGLYEHDHGDELRPALLSSPAGSVVFELNWLYSAWTGEL